VTDYTHHDAMLTWDHRILATKQRQAGADAGDCFSQPRKVFPNQLTVAAATGGDELVYALYLPAPRLRPVGGLTPEEIKIVESASAPAMARQWGAAK